MANALYFNAGWGVTFDEELLTESFYGKAGAKDTQYFTRTGDFGYTSSDGIQFLSIPYGTGVYDFVAILPEEGKTLDDALALLRSDKGKKILSDLVPKEGMVELGNYVHVQLPCFEINSGTGKDDIKDALTAMGAPLPFLKTADFSRISSVPLYIASIIQKAFVAVNEKGTEAAAVTVVCM